MMAMICFISAGLSVLISVSCEKFENMAVFVGNRTKMTSCGNNDTKILWQLCNYRGTDTVYNGWTVAKNYTSRFSVNNNYDLLINDTQLDDAGIYICFATEGKNWKAHLIVLSSNPSCNATSTTGTSESTVWCSVEFQGLWPPSMNWTVQGTRSLIEENTTIHDSGRHKTLTSMIVLRLNDTGNSTEDNILVSCRTFFDESNVNVTADDNTSTNVPVYEFVWSTRVLQLPLPITTGSTQSQNIWSDSILFLAASVVGLFLTVLTIVIYKLIKDKWNANLESKSEEISYDENFSSTRRRDEDQLNLRTWNDDVVAYAETSFTDVIQARSVVLYSEVRKAPDLMLSSEPSKKNKKNGNFRKNENVPGDGTVYEVINERRTGASRGPLSNPAPLPLANQHYLPIDHNKIAPPPPPPLPAHENHRPKGRRHL